MDKLLQQDPNTPSLEATGVHGEDEYLFYRFPEGNPPDQIKAYVRSSGIRFEQRVSFEKLPTAALQETFLALTGKKAEEIGVTIWR